MSGHSQTQEHDSIRLQVAFDHWRYAHGDEWDDTERSLAEAIVEVLGVDLKWEDE